MLTTFKSLLIDESGATAIEYGLIAALIAVALIGALQAVGGSLNSMFTAVSGALDANAPTP
jgi:pilus assembly protein Flp/PilA